MQIIDRSLLGKINRRKHLLTPANSHPNWPAIDVFYSLVEGGAWRHMATTSWFPSCGAAKISYAHVYCLPHTRVKAEFHDK